MSRRIEDLTPELGLLALKFLTLCHAEGIHVIVTQTLRTMEEQAELYAQGRNGDPRPIVTNAKPGESRHNDGTAFDVAFTNSDGGVTWEGPWEAVGRIGESLGLEWGGRWPGLVDRPHFQLRRKAPDPPSPARPTLRRGDHTATVSLIQRQLQALGYFREKTIGEAFGPATERAVKRFQKAHGLVQDGVAGPLTQAAIARALQGKEGKG